MQKKKYYVVWSGRQTGIFHSWPECFQHVDKFPRAAFKSFPSLSMAELAFERGEAFGLGVSPMMENFTPGICVDAACNSLTGVVEFRGILVPDQLELFSYGPFQKGSNNLGEFLAIVKALQHCSIHQLDLPIYSDSMIALKWVRNKSIRSRVAREAANAPLFELVDEALDWIGKHHFDNLLLKWDTAQWGEIPADYGRK